MQIKQANFVISSPNAKGCPKPDYPEYAFIGRSNVGKSSLINMLCQRKSLAKTSSTPGKTQLINHFLINDTWYLVDLPGYGYAKVSKGLRAGFSKIITDYVTNRSNLMCLFVLVDSRHPAQKKDIEFMQMLGEKGIPFSIIFTKIDKLSKSALEKNITNYDQTLLESWEELPPRFYSSATKQSGRDEILNYIDDINEKW
ncbi:YihA family ribosome biogenesis GTP-binding protein [Marinilabiliaceae bacterium JC017]|nr:YihA family ribosome biogenesis GTP-binding protein [Marinilabiliaceae bacterium JC017]